MTELNRPLDTMDEVAYRELEAENKKLKKKVHDAELETSLVKAIGINSPEMKALRQKNQELKKEICELRNDNRQLSNQIEDRINRLRKAGL
jgi:predicted RNase H-like nuclease (RuvC/YqgF family)